MVPFLEHLISILAEVFALTESSNLAPTRMTQPRFFEALNQFYLQNPINALGDTSGFYSGELC